MKKMLLAALLAVTLNSNAQLQAFINGKEVKSGGTILPKDLPSLQISFKNPKKVTVISGASVLYAQLLDADKRDIQMFFTQKEGYVAIEDFFKSAANKKHKVFGTDGFPNRGNTLDWILSSAKGQEKQKTMQLKVGFYVVEETGYQKYGPQVQLNEPLVFNVPVWDAKNLALPFLDLAIDKTNVVGDIDHKQTGQLDRKETVVGYRLREKEIWYGAFAIDSDNFPGMNVQELADDFIHGGTVWANYNNLYNSKKAFKDYDIAKYTIPYDDFNGLCDEKLRLSQLSYQVNKANKKANLMDLYEKVTVNGLKGYKFTSNTESRSHINASDWKDKGNFVIYILEHPTNPKLTLVVSSNVANDKNTIAETDAVLMKFINAIKK
ncbi:hypothetical protein [Flavobacterium sp.]|uniref:hypothetical protein n=1 Tax=Flavobacterium sp. TaxID=239 RepID=UPI0012103EC5|nr:hypothetical protein [Flavobacterium sp.]RZJ68942.1 MAG: hypothetical protein EOO49_19040 [Flavobacterium sp.]